MTAHPMGRGILVLLLASWWDGNIKSSTTHALSSSPRRRRVCGGGGCDFSRTTPPRSSSSSSSSHSSCYRPLMALAASAEGYAPTRERIADRNPPNDDDVMRNDDEVSNGGSGVDVVELSIDDAREGLLDLLPRMTGTAIEYRNLESYINLLEDMYEPVRTLDFLNFAMAGDWQLLFTTSFLGRGPIAGAGEGEGERRLRLRGDLIQRVEPDGFDGKLSNVASWEYAESDDDVYDAYGEFNVVCKYRISRGSRMEVVSNDLELRPSRGSRIPGDVSRMVGHLHSAMPRELFDPSGHSMDITYLDANLRIVRLTGSNHEGVRNIFIRRGSMEICPPHVK